MMCKVLDAVDRIRFVSQSERSLVERVLPVPKGKAIVRGVGIPHSVAPGEPDPPPPLRVIVIGNVARNKGADVLLGLAGRLASEPIELEFAGAIQPEYVEPLRQLSQAGVTVRGSYEPEDVGQILKGHHVALFASSWPETFVITLSEAFRAGVVPVVPNIGAFAERVRDGENGLVVRGDSASYLCALLSLLNDPELLERLRSGALATRPPTLEDSLSLMRNTYRALAAEYDVAASVKPTPWEADSSLAIPISDIRAGPEEPPCTTPAVLQRVLRVYRLAGVRGVARRVWTKIRSGRRSA
jgi:glycosyltransferase involved in cell wall biosynthesis